MKIRTKEEREIDAALNIAQFKAVEAERDRQSGRVPSEAPKPIFHHGEKVTIMKLMRHETSRQKMQRANELAAEVAKLDALALAKKNAEATAEFDPRGGLSPEAYAALSGETKLMLFNKADAARRAAGK